MVEILTRLKVEMNGAVVDSMKEKGIVYPMSYGVSVPAIKKAVEEYLPDNELSRLLYRQDVRELKLAAVYVADPAGITTGDIGFWGSGVVNSEVAEHLGTVLLSRTAVIGEILGRWLVSGDALLAYTALMAAGRNLMINEGYPVWNWEKTVENIKNDPGGILASEERFIWRGISSFLMNLVRRVPGSTSLAKNLLDIASAENYPSAGYLREEIGWLLD